MYKIGDPWEVNAAYTIGGVLTAGLTVTCSLVAPDGTITAPAVTDRGGGLYRASPTLSAAGTWIAIFNTVAVVDSQNQLAATECGYGGVEFLDVPVSSRAPAPTSSGCGCGQPHWYCG